MCFVRLISTSAFHGNISFLYSSTRKTTILIMTLVSVSSMVSQLLLKFWLKHFCAMASVFWQATPCTRTGLVLLSTGFMVPNLSACKCMNKYLRLSYNPPFNPLALRLAKTLWGFGRSECKRVKAVVTECRGM